MRVLDRIGQTSVEWQKALPEVPHERPGSRTQNAVDLGQTRLRVGPVMHLQRTDDQVERSFRERHRGHVAEEERRPVLVAVPRPDGVGPSARDHGRIKDETDHIEAVLASQPDRQVTRSAAHLKNLCAVRGDVVYLHYRTRT